MTFEEFYGPAYGKLLQAEQQLLASVREYEKEAQNPDRRVIQYCKSRIKEPKSAEKKLRRKGADINPETALTQLHDVAGIRIVCSFADDVYQVVRWFEQREEYKILERKDYYAVPKPNGYRSYHLILKICSGPGEGVTAEIQIRTIATDFWASLEHQMKYKHEIRQEELIRRELKNCADEIASVDLSMQTLRELIVRCSD